MVDYIDSLVLDWVSSKWVPFQLRVCFGATVLIAVSYDWAPPLPGGNCIAYQRGSVTSTETNLSENYV